MSAGSVKASVLWTCVCESLLRIVEWKQHKRLCTWRRPERWIHLVWLNTRAAEVQNCAAHIITVTPPSVRPQQLLLQQLQDSAPHLQGVRVHYSAKRTSLNSHTHSDRLMCHIKPLNGCLCCRQVFYLLDWDIFIYSCCVRWPGLLKTSKINCIIMIIKTRVWKVSETV